MIAVLFLSFCYNVKAEVNYRKEVKMVQQVNASHILVATEAEAKTLKAEIENGASFEELAKEHSKCPSGYDGGKLGYFTRGQMVKPFEDAAFETEIGKISDPVQTQFGWHLIKVIDKK